MSEIDAIVAELERLEKEATPGEWHADIGPLHVDLFDGENLGGRIATFDWHHDHDDPPDNPAGAADARFIAYARNHLPAVLAALKEAREWQDKPLPEDAQISAAFPTRSGSYDTYAEAMRLVGARHSKGSLVALVNWLLVDRDTLRAQLEKTAADALTLDSENHVLRAKLEAAERDRDSMARQLSEQDITYRTKLETATEALRQCNTFADCLCGTVTDPECASCIAGAALAKVGM